MIPPAIIPPANGVAQGVSQVTLAVNCPVPTEFERKRKVIHPEVFNAVALITTPCNSLPVYVPKVGEAVEGPS